MLSVLHSPSHTISHTGAQVIAAFGAVDVQRGGWDSLLPSLFGNVSAQDSPLTAKVSSLEVCVQGYCLFAQNKFLSSRRLGSCVKKWTPMRLEKK